MSEWLPADDAVRARIPRALWSWLVEAGSLTRRLQAECDGFNLALLEERTTVLGAADAVSLGLERGAGARVREVELRCGAVPCIHARSLLPDTTLAGAGRALASLGTRPLGDALFADPRMTRGPIEVATDGGDPPRWARRSVFRIAGAPLLVCETFLPGLFECTR